jgi:solute carrier family 12 (potassium/chloride transporter), member 4/6
VSVRDTIHAQSRGSDVVILGLATPEEGNEEKHARRLFDLADGLPTCFFVNNGSLFIGELITGASDAEMRIPLPATVDEKR